MLRSVEALSGITYLPRFKTESRRPRKQGGESRAYYRKRRYEMAAEDAKREIVFQRFGEPSTAFYPPKNGIEKSNVVIFEEHNGTVATEKDIEDRMRYQLETCVVAEHLGQMTREWYRFKFNHLHEVVSLLG